MLLSNDKNNDNLKQMMKMRKVLDTYFIGSIRFISCA